MNEIAPVPESKDYQDIQAHRNLMSDRHIFIGKNISILEIVGEKLFLEKPAVIEEDVADFFSENWVKSEYLNETMRMVSKGNSYSILHKSKEVWVIRNQNGEVMALSATDLADEGDIEDLGTFIVSQAYQGKGIATQLANLRVSEMLDKGASSITTVAVSEGGLALVEKIKAEFADRISLSIDISPALADEIITDIFTKFTTDYESYSPIVYDLIHTGKMELKLSPEAINRMRDEVGNQSMGANDVVGWIRRTNAVLFMDLWKEEDLEEIKRKLSPLGIILK